MQSRDLSRLPSLSILFGAGLLALACAESGGGDSAALEPEGSVPDGMASVGGEETTRVYYQFIDDKGSVRFVERLSDVPEAWRDRVGHVAMASPPPLAPADAVAQRRAQTASLRSDPEKRHRSSAWKDREAIAQRKAAREAVGEDRIRELAEQAYEDQVALAERWRNQPRSVVLYWAKWCGYCKRAEAHLDREGVEYERRDIDVPAAADELVALAGQKSVPVLDVDGKITRGYRASTYDEIVRTIQGS